MGPEFDIAAVLAEVAAADERFRAEARSESPQDLSLPLLSRKVSRGKIKMSSLVLTQNFDTSRLQQDRTLSSEAETNETFLQPPARMGLEFAGVVPDVRIQRDVDRRRADSYCSPTIPRHLNEHSSSPDTTKNQHARRNPESSPPRHNSSCSMPTGKTASPPSLGANLPNSTQRAKFNARERESSEDVAMQTAIATDAKENLRTAAGTQRRETASGFVQRIRARTGNKDSNTREKHLLFASAHLP